MAVDDKPEQVTLHIADCKGVCLQKPKGNCDKYVLILGLIKAFRKESQRLNYKFEVLKKNEMPYTIQINKPANLRDEKDRKPQPMKISIGDMFIDPNTNDIRKQVKRFDAYLTVRFKNGETRVIIIDKICVE